MGNTADQIGIPFNGQRTELDSWVARNAERIHHIEARIRPLLRRPFAVRVRFVFDGWALPVLYKVEGLPKRGEWVIYSQRIYDGFYRMDAWTRESSCATLTGAMDRAYDTARIRSGYATRHAAWRSQGADSEVKTMGNTVDQMGIPFNGPKDELDSWVARNAERIHHIEARIRPLLRRPFSARVRFVFDGWALPVLYKVEGLSKRGEWVIYSQPIVLGFYRLDDWTRESSCATLTRAMDRAYDTARIRSGYTARPTRE